MPQSTTLCCLHSNVIEQFRHGKSSAVLLYTQIVMHLILYLGPCLGLSRGVKYNVIPRLNELHPYSFRSHYQVWINYVCVVSDDNEMMMIKAHYHLNIGSSGDLQHKTLVQHCSEPEEHYIHEKTATSCKLVKTSENTSDLITIFSCSFGHIKRILSFLIF